MQINASAYNIKTTFKTETGASNGFRKFNEWLKKANKHVLAEKEGENGNYTIYGLRYVSSDVFFAFNIESTSKDNLIWQLTNACNYLKNLSGFISFKSEIFIKDSTFNFPNL
jgi:hypothetical protein